MRKKLAFARVLVEQREHARRQLGVRAVVEGGHALPAGGAGGVEPAQVRPEEPAAQQEHAGGEDDVICEQRAQDPAPWPGLEREGNRARRV